MMPDLRFAFWIPQEPVVPRWSHAPAGAADRFAYVKWLTQLAEERGFDYAFAPARSTVGAFARLDALAVTSALAGVTRRIGLIPTLRPYLRQPRLTAKTIHSIDAISGGRAGVNILAAATGDDLTSYGEMLDHDEQHRRIAEFVRVLRAVWQEEVAAAGPSAPSAARPVGGGLPVFHSGGAHAARELAGGIADWYVIDRDRPAVIAARIGQVRDAAERAGRDPHAIRFALSGLVVMREGDRCIAGTSMGEGAAVGSASIGRTGLEPPMTASMRPKVRKAGSSRAWSVPRIGSPTGSPNWNQPGSSSWSAASWTTRTTCPPSRNGSSPSGRSRHSRCRARSIPRSGRPSASAAEPGEAERPLGAVPIRRQRAGSSSDPRRAAATITRTSGLRWKLFSGRKSAARPWRRSVASTTGPIAAIRIRPSASRNAASRPSSRATSSYRSTCGELVKATISIRPAITARIASATWPVSAAVA
jgi:hypothetical protein